MYSSKNKKHKLAIVTLSLFLLSGCVSAGFDLNEHLEQQPQIDYSPGFQKELPYQQLVSSIQLQNREMTHDEFTSYKSAVYMIHHEAVQYTLDELNIPQNIKRNVLRDLKNNQDELATFYVAELAKASKARAGRNHEKTLNYPRFSSVNEFTDVASQNMSFIMDSFLGFVDRGVAKRNSLAAATKPFQILLYKALLPISEGLRAQALIDDQIHARFKLKSQINKMITELGTISRKYNNSVVDQPGSRKFKLKSKTLIWSKSSAIIEAGFDLRRYFRVELDSVRKELLITLPEPIILSIATKSNFQNIENGWFAKITEERMNEFHKLERREFTALALDAGIVDEAKQNIEGKLIEILTPIVQTPYFNYDVAINFQPGTYRSVALVQ